MGLIALQDLLTPLTKDQITQRWLDNLTAYGFPVNNWLVGSPIRTLVKAGASVLVEFSNLIPLIASGLYGSTAQGDWLTNYCYSRFGESRKVATFTGGYFYFTTAPGVSVNFSPGSIVAQGNGLRFKSNGTGTIAPNSSLSVPVIAEHAGAAYNLANNTTLTLVTQVAGLTVTNPIYAGSSWITSQGQDQEDDPTLWARCQAKWGTLAVTPPKLAYQYWAQAADPLIRRVIVGDPDGFGAFSVYVAGSTSTALPGPTITAAQAYIDARKGIGATPTVTAASTQSQAFVVNVTTRLTDPLTSTQVQAAVQAWVDALPIGGEVIGGLGKIWNYSLVEAARATSSQIKRVTATPADTAVTAGNIVVASSMTVTITRE